MGSGFFEIRAMRLRIVTGEHRLMFAVGLVPGVALSQVMLHGLLTRFHCREWKVDAVRVGLGFDAMYALFLVLHCFYSSYSFVYAH